MSSKNTGKTSKNGAHDHMPPAGDVLGGPDPAGHEDISSAPGQEPNPGKDVMGGPDTAGPEDIMSPHGDD